ncbi:unnamed protein product [Durusdinium trenchii]|uniref:Uncharacterized protein n=2 Tax=Durusdinium trenchii TaxID=1381693 RepID=A0ABP0QGX0_9DINO
MATDGSGGDALQEMTQCVLCHQTFGSDDKDCPDGHTMSVQPSKSQNHGSCMKCLYIHRGSFKNVPLPVLVSEKAKSEALESKFAKLRSTHVVLLCKNPRAKPRHEHVDYKLYTVKEDQSYLDVRKEMIWMSIRDYFDKHADADARKRCKNLSQKKSYLVNTLQISLQMDDEGQEGVAIEKNPGQKVITLGKKVSTSKVKHVDHDSKQEAADAHEKARSNLQVNVQSQEKVDEKLKDINEKAAESSSSSSSSSESESNSSESEFGLPQTKSKAARAKNPERSAREAAKPQPRSKRLACQRCPRLRLLTWPAGWPPQDQRGLLCLRKLLWTRPRQCWRSWTSCTPLTCGQDPSSQKRWRPGSPRLLSCQAGSSSALQTRKQRN